MMEIETGSIAAVEHEVALLLRLAESTAKRAEMLDRSAYLLLGALEERGPLGIAALAEIFQVDLSTASRQTAALEARGLVDRLADPHDGRVSLLQITPHGRAQLAATREARRALFAAILDGWSERECREFGAYLARFNQAIVRRRRRISSERASRDPPR